MRLIPLGGLGEIGKNLWVVEFGKEIIMVDAGLAFPDVEMFGVDIVIPDMNYILENRDRVKGLFITHGHEDHTGAIPYLLKELSVPVHATRLVHGLIKRRLNEHNLALPSGSRVFKPGDSIKTGCFRVEPFRVNHSIPDAVGLAIHTPVGLIIHTGDFKFDQTPVDGQVTDFGRLADWGQKGVHVLLADSTNADRPGYTPSEKTVGEVLDGIIARAPGRILFATFASNLHRIQQAVTSAHAHRRKVAVVGRSVENNVQVALELGYLKMPEGTFIEADAINRQQADRIMIITTGTQGEPMSALSRMATGDHRLVGIVPGDTVIIAASPIPGNESLVYRVVDNLFRLGAEVIHGRGSGVHVSGHGAQEELKLMLNMIRPRFLIPVHGEYRHLMSHVKLARQAGIPKDNILVGENGSVFEVTRDRVRINGKVTAGAVMVDGLGVGDVGNIVLRDRKQLALDGILIIVAGINRQTGALVSGPDIISRGFVYMRESESLIDESRKKIIEVLASCQGRHVTDWPSVKGAVKEAMTAFLFERTGRRPMVLPVIMEI